MEFNFQRDVMMMMMATWNPIGTHNKRGILQPWALEFQMWRKQRLGTWITTTLIKSPPALKLARFFSFFFS